MQGNLELYRIKQDYVNYNSCSAYFRKESLRLYHYAGNNPERYIDPDGMLDCGIFNDYNGFDVNQFRFTSFNEKNPLNQLILDKALKIRSTGRSTASCQTTAMINAYGAQIENGITGKQILDALTFDGKLKDTLAEDGSPASSLDSLSADIAKACDLNIYLKPDNKKIGTSILSNLKDGAILGYSKDGKKDAHFGFKNWQITIDSLDPNRPSAKKYTEHTYRILRWTKLPKELNK